MRGYGRSHAGMPLAALQRRLLDQQLHKLPIGRFDSRAIHRQPEEIGALHRVATRLVVAKTSIKHGNTVNVSPPDLQVDEQPGHLQASNPFGFIDCQRQLSLHIASMSRVAFQPSSASALAGSA